VVALVGDLAVAAVVVAAAVVPQEAGRERI